MLLPRSTRTLTGKTLMRLATGGAVVVLLAAALGTWLLYREMEGQAVNRMAARVAERTRVAEQVLNFTAETHEAIRRAFVEQWPAYQTATASKRFDTLMERYPDGALRNRKAIADGTRFPTGWVHRNSPLTDDLRRRMVLFYDLSASYGPGAALRRDNLYFVSLPEESNMGYDPVLYPNWIFDIDETFSHQQYEWGRIAYEEVPPGTPTRWAPPAADTEAPTPLGPVLTGLTPLHIGGRHVATVGTTLLLSDLLARVFPPASAGSPDDFRYLLFHADGRLFADTTNSTVQPRQVGHAQLTMLGGDLPRHLAAAATRPAGPVALTGYSAGSDAYYAIGRIAGPGWYIATVLPGAHVRADAMGPALWVLGSGVVVLLTLLAIFATVLRRHVAAPLGALTHAAEGLAAGDTGIRLAAHREDELGRLSKAFNHMTAQVAERDAALRRDKLQIEAALTSLRHTEERWRAMTDNASDVIAVLGEDGVLHYVSPSVEKMLGHPADALRGRQAFDLVHPEDRAPLQDGLLAPTGKPRTFRAAHASGAWRVVEVVGRDMRHHPAIGGLVLNLRDVSEATQAREELARQREALHQSEKLTALGSLLAGVAHELNNPLAIVMGRAAQLQDSAAAPVDRDRAARIHQAAERCGRIVRTFLAMARRQEAVRMPTDVNEVVRDALEVLAYPMDSGGVLVRAELGAGLPPVMADADQLGQVVMNLCTNAQQAMGEQAGPRVLTVASRLERGWVKLTVRDSGPGIPPEVATRIFEPFFTTKEVGVGTGVGLSVSLGIAQSHGGTLGLLPSKGGGACFELALPGLGTGPGVEQATSTPAPSSRAVPLRVLVVDDEVEIAEILRDLLVVAGHRVTLAHDGRQALQRLGGTAFDLVLTDLKMPGMDGPALYREIVQRHPALARRVVALTGDTLAASARAFLDWSQLPVIDKPFEADDVAAVVAAYRPLAPATADAAA